MALFLFIEENKLCHFVLFQANIFKSILKMKEQKKNFNYFSVFYEFCIAFD